MIDNLIFPAPRAGYNESSYPEKLIYIPKHKDYHFYLNELELKKEIKSLGAISDIESMINSDSVNIDNTPSPPRMRNINSSQSGVKGSKSNN